MSQCAVVVVYDPPAVSCGSRDDRDWMQGLSMPTAPWMQQPEAERRASPASSIPEGEGFHRVIQLMGILGRGSFAQVYAGRCVNTPLAVKVWVPEGSLA